MSLTFDYRSFFNEDDDESSREYWGEAAAGCIFLAKDTGRILLAHRSARVSFEPKTWGTWGGKIDLDETPIQTVEREVEEETGFSGQYKIHHLYTYQDGDFKYYNYLIIVPFEFKPKLNWENDGSTWVEFGDWPLPLHFGLKALFTHAGHKIKKIVDLLKKKQDNSLEKTNSPVINEIASPDIVVGIIDFELNVVSSNNIKNHGDLIERHSEWKTKPWVDLIYWRYNNREKTVYWYQARTTEQEEVVSDELERKYKFSVRTNVYIGQRQSDLYFKLQSKAHGLTEDMNTPPAHYQQAVSSAISPEFINYIKMAENGTTGPLPAKHLKIYNVAGEPHIGYGHKVKPGEVNTFKNGITQKQADELLIRDLEVAKKDMYDEIKSMFKVVIPLDQRQEEMLLDFEFNLGTLKTFPKFTRAVLNKDWEAVKKEYERSYKDEKGVKHKLGRNNLFFNRYLKEQKSVTITKAQQMINEDANGFILSKQGLVDDGITGYEIKSPYSYLRYGFEPTRRVFYLYNIGTPKSEDKNKGYAKAILEFFFQLIKQANGALVIESYTGPGNAYIKHVVERLAEQYKVRLI